MKKVIVVALVAVFAASAVNLSPAYARGKKRTSPEKEIKGTVTVTKSGMTLTDIKITTSDMTDYEVKIDTKGQELAQKYVGMQVSVKGILGMIDGKKSITVEKIETTSPSKKTK